MHPLLRWPLALAALGVGAATGLATVVLHHTAWALPAALVTVLVTVTLPWWARLGFVAGWVLVAVRAMLPTPSGDYLIGADARGYALLGLGLGLVVACVVGLPASRAGRESGQEPPAT